MESSTLQLNDACAKLGILLMYYSLYFESNLLHLMFVRYVGPDCDTCDSPNGYIEPVNAPGLCVINQCIKPDACSCFNSTCETTLGHCSTNVTGMAQCDCNKMYTGDRCEQCAVGYRQKEWPYCDSVWVLFFCCETVLLTFMLAMPSVRPRNLQGPQPMQVWWQLGWYWLWHLPL